MYRPILTCCFLMLGLLVSAEAFAQPGGSRGQGRGGQQGMMQSLPVMSALDADQDGKISKEEIANASEALLTLDKDGNGILESAEMRPVGGFGRGQRGGRGGKGGRGKGGGKGGKGGGNSGVSSKVFDFLAEKYDENGDKKISPEEHNRGEELFARLDKDNDQFLTAKDWEIEAPRGQSSSKKSLTAPVEGTVAPDFELTLVEDPEKTVKLSSFAGQKPVA